MTTGNQSRLLRNLYLTHLAAPILIGGGCVLPWHKGDFSLKMALVLVGLSLWVIVGALAFFASGNRENFLKKTLNPLLSFYTIVVLLLCAEVGLRIFYHSGPFLRVPGKHAVFQTTEQVTPGIAPGKKLFSVDNVGLRGPNLPRNADALYKIIALGGSTTECLYLDDSEDWPQLLMNELNRQPAKPRVWVGNAGFSAHTTVHHLKVLQNLPIFDKAQMLILMIGINDLQDYLAREGTATDSLLDEDATTFVDKLRRRTYSHSAFFHRSEIYQVIDQTFRRDQLTGQGMDPAWYGSHRKQRVESKVLPLPDLGLGVAEYRRRILALSRECRNKQLRCLFTTQPVMWRDGLSPDEQRLLWFGWIGPMDKPKGYVAAGDLARAMNAYNQTLLDTCAQSGLECYDLASFVPKDTSALFDDCHFNENGARLVAHLLALYLHSRPLAARR